MNCKFKFNNGAVTYESKDYESAENFFSALLTAHPELWQENDLNYFNADGEQVKNIFNQLESKRATFKPQGTSVTDARSNSFKDSDTAVVNKETTSASTETVVAYESYYNFCKNYGDLLHNCIDALHRHGKDSSEYKKALEILQKFMQDMKNRVSDLKWDTVIGSENAKRTLDYIKQYDPEKFKLSVLNAISEVEKAFKKEHGQSYSVLTELPVQVISPAAINGRIDAVTFDDDGNVIIWDFKTSNASIASTKTLQGRYAQLEMYKQLLIKNGIPESKIKTRNIQLSYSIINGSEPKIEVKATDPAKGRFSINDQSVVHNVVKRWFPKTGTDLPVSDIEERKRKANDIKETIISPLAISKMSTSQQEQYLTKKIENNRETVLYQLKDDRKRRGVVIYSWSKNGDIISGLDEKGKELIKGTIKEIAENEANALLEQLQGTTSVIAELLRTKDYSRLPYLFNKNAERQSAICYALEPYLSQDFEYIKIDALEANNIITMYNHLTDSYSFIVVSDLANLNSLRIQNKPCNLIESVLKDPKLLKEFRETGELPEASAQNMLTFQALIDILSLKDTISADKIKIDRVQVISSSSAASSMGCNLGGFKQALNILQHYANTKPESVENSQLLKTIHTDLENAISFEKSETVLKSIVINRISTFKFNNPNIGSDCFSSVAMDMTYDNICTTLENIKREFPTEFLNMQSEIGRIYAGLQELRHLIKSGEFYNKLYAHTSKGLSIAETLGAGIDLVRFGETKKYTANGMMIAGVLQGLDSSSSYSNPDEILSYYNKAFSRATQLITNELNDVAVELNLATKKFLDKEGKLGFQAAVIGNTNSAYEKLFEQANGKLNDSMLLINPYRESELAPHQREYLEIVLWTINRLRIPNSVLDSKYRSMTYEEFKKTEQFDDYKDLISTSVKYRQAPLLLKSGFKGFTSQVRNLFDSSRGGKDIKERTSKFAHKFGDMLLSDIQPLLLTPEQKTEIDKNINEKTQTFEYHSPYNAQGEYRVELTSSHNAYEWETNLNILALEYACAQFKETYYHDILEQVSDLLSVIKIQETITGGTVDLKKTREALINRMKVSIFNMSLIDPEDKGIALAVSGLKSIVSSFTIAMRPALAIKEMCIGIIKNVSNVWAKTIVNDYPITQKNLMKAATMVYTNGLFSDNAGKFEGETFGDFRLINLLNNRYRINDRDVSVLGESISYDHSGITRVGSRMLYTNVTTPDWFNRMMILLAKMDADGTLDSHSVGKNGELVYDMYKDKRFAPFLQWKRAHPDAINEPKDADYQEAKALYKYKIAQFKKEGYANLTANDIDGYSPLPQCYTLQEMDSLKEQIGMLYGYYSHEERASMQKGISWLMHTQFLTFLPGEVRKYLASGNYDSCVGRTVHLIDPISKKKLYYVMNEAGFHEKVTEDKIKPGQEAEPVMEFVHTPVEGLLVSTIKTFADIKNGTFDKELKPEQWDRTKLFLFNILFAWLINGIIGLWMFMSDGNNGGADEMAWAELETIDLMKRVGQEFNGVENIISPVMGYGISGTAFIQRVTGSIARLVTSDSYTVMDAANSTLPIVKDLHVEMPEE